MNIRLTRLLAGALLVSGLAASGVTVVAPRAVLAAAATCNIGTTLREGSSGGDVVCLETQLIARGLPGVIGPDDYFGPSTTQAVLTFQTAHGLAADGIVGPRTRIALATVSPGGVVPGPPVPPHVLETRTIGTSVQGRPIMAVRMGTPGGRVVMIVGIIHGDETKGALVTAALRTIATPAGIDLWLIDDMNPDGVAANTRVNANGVDLNRNFDVGWNYIPRSTTNHQYSGERPEDQPERQAIAAFVTAIQPAVAIFYHQDANVVSVNGARRLIPTAYSKLVGQGTGSVPCSQQCTGTAGTYVNHTVAGSTTFLVELPGSAAVTTAMVRRHAVAVLAVAVL